MDTTTSMGTPDLGDLQRLSGRLDRVAGEVEDLREMNGRLLTPEALQHLEEAREEFKRVIAPTSVAASPVFQRVVAEHCPMRLARVRDMVFDMQDLVLGTLRPERKEFAAVDRQINREVDQEFAAERRAAREARPRQVDFDLGM
jgi:hypothetical protein